MRIEIVFNPASGSFRPQRLESLQRALKEQGWSVHLAETRPDGVELSGDADLICAHGGDGTARLVAGAMGKAVREVPLCIAPSGTINLLARELNYPRNAKRWAQKVTDAFREGQESWLHSPLFRFADRPVLACLSAGPDSAAVANLDPALKGRIGRYAYLAAGLKLWRNWPRHPISLRGEMADGSEFAMEAQAAFVARSRLYAGPFRLSPRAHLASETVELVTMHKAGRRRSLAFGAGLVSRLPLDRLRVAEIRTMRCVEIDNSPLPIQVDGDFVEARSGVIAPTGLNVMYCG